MKRLFLLLFIGLGLHYDNNCQERGMALVGVGLISGSVFCGIEAGVNQWQIWETHDPYQKRAIIVCRNNWLKGGMLSGTLGMALLSKAAKEDPTKFYCGLGASAMFGMAASIFNESRKYHEEFVKTENLSLAEIRDKMRLFSGLSALVGAIFCVPIVYDGEES